MKTTFNNILNISLVLVSLIVFGGKAWATDFTLVKDASTLTSGDRIIIVNSDDTYAISTTQNNNNRAATSVSASQEKITPSASVQVLTLGTGSTNKSYWTLYTGSQYLYAASSTANRLKQQNNVTVDAEWEFTIDSDGNATIIASGSSNRNEMDYNANNGSPIFNCYSTGGTLHIYKEAASNFTVTVIKNQDGWGTISATSVTNVAPNTTISASSNVLTVGTTTVTATAHAQDADYNYAFSSWTGIPAGGKVTADVTITANFTRTARALTNYRTKCCTPLDAINGSYTGATTSGVTLVWDDIENVSGWTVTGVDDQSTAVAVGNIGTPTDVGDTYNCVISNLISGKTYTFTITPTHTAAYCSVYEDNIVNVPIPLATSTVTFDDNGKTSGSVPADITQNTGTTVTVPSNTGSLAKDNYEFGGWNTQPDGEGTNYAADATFTLSGNITLYAKWNCAKKVNVAAGTPSNGSFSLSATGDKYTCDGTVVITVTNITPSSGHRFGTITQTGLASGVTIDQANKTVTYSQYANGNSTINVTFEEIPTYTITWSVNGATNTLEVVDGDALVLPTPAPTTDGCEDGKTFVGWTATEIDGSTDSKPSDLFTTVGGAPAINSNKTFYAVFASVSGGNYAEANTVLWSEDFSGFSAGDAPNTSYNSGTGRTIYNGGSVTYACQDGNSATKLYAINNPNNTGGETPEILINKKSSADVPGAFSISGIPTGGAATMTLTYRANGTGITISSGTSGISIGNRTGSNPYSHTVTVTGEVTSFDLAFTNATNSNLRMDNYSVVVATAGSSSESGYITSCTKQVKVEATEGGSATINGEAAVDWTSFETDLTLEATPDEGYVFAGWSYDDEVVVVENDDAAETTANATGSATITANFVAGSTITADKESLALVAYIGEPDEATVTFTSSNAPQYGSVYYEITDWTDTEDTYITAAPALTYPISTTSLDETVTISYGSDVAGSFSANLVATAYNTNNLVVGTKVIPITLTIKPKFTVTVAGEHATTKSASPNTDVKDGQTVTLSQTAADDWVFQKWTISYTLNAVAYNEDLDGNTFTMPAADVTATAVYTEKSGTDLTAPTNAKVDDESITYHRATLSWDAVEHASSYSVYVVGTNYEETFDGITETSYTVTGLKAETEYMWTVTAIGDGVNYYTSSAADGAEFTTTARILSSIAIKTDASKMTYNEGETFVKTGLEVTATYDDETTATISAASLVVTNEPLEVGTTSITVSYTENEVLKSTTLEGITVNELGSVTWSANGVTNEVKYAEGAAIVFPESASGCFGKSFVGWSESEIDGETDDAPTLVTSATMGATNKTYYAVFAIVENSNEEKSYGFEDSEPDASYWTVDNAIVKDDEYKATGSYAGKINSNNTYVTFKYKVNVTNFSFNFARTSNNASYNVYIEKSTDGETWTAVKTVDMSTFDRYGSFSSVSQDFDGETALYVRFHCYNTTAIRYVDDVHIAYSATTGSKYATSCCTPYNITISDAIEHGTVSTGEVTAACEGTEITLSANVVDEGYEFGAWTVMQGESDITESNVEGNVLTMPAGNVTVSASFNKIAVESVTINGEANVQINNDVVWTLEITPEEARPTVVWSTADNTVATVNNGTVHGVAVGETTITATVDGTPYNKTINVIAATVLNSISISTPQTEFTMGDAFVAPETVTANYIYEVGGAPAPSVDVTASATVSGYNMNVAGEQTVIVSYENKDYEYTINVAPWTLHLQTKRLYGNDVETPTVVDATVTTLESPTELSGYYVANLCEGYTQLGYITSSEDIDAEPAEVLTSYTPSTNNEKLYGVFQQTSYEGQNLVDEDFSSITTTVTNAEINASDFDWLDSRNKVYPNTGEVKLGSGSANGSLTTIALDLSHAFVVKVKARQYDTSEKTIKVTVGEETKQVTNMTSTSTEYTFNFDAATNTSQVVISASKRAYVDEIHIYTLSDIAYTSVYDCREPKDVTYEIGNDKVVWTACENTTVMEGQNYTLCANEPSLQGYDFGGWIINGDEENVKAAGTTIEVAEDLTITPKFTEHVYDYSYALAATATNGTIASVTVNGVAKDLAEVALHDGDAVVVTAVPNTNYELSEWTHSENVSLTTDANMASFTVAVGAGDMTIAAVFVEKAQYTMTLNVFGRTYTTKQGHEGDTYSSVLDGAQSPALTGYTFQGWSTDADDADAIITGEELLTADVTLYAIVGSSQPTGYVYNKVTSLGDITDDGYYLIVNEAANKAFDGSRNSSSNLDANNNYVSVSISENKIISNAAIDAAIVTIGTIPENDSLYIKTATGYYIGNNGSNGLLANKNTIYRNALSFSDGNFVVNSGAKQNNVDMVLMFNNGNNRFGYYKGTQQAIQLYKRGDVHNEIIPEAEPEIEISTAVTASTSYPGGYVGDVTVVNGGSLNADINLSVGDLIIHSTLGKGTGTGAGSGNNPGTCGQVANGNNITVNGDVYLELELTQDEKASEGWYAFSVPFKVDALNGVYYGDTKLQNEVGYAIMSHYGDLRAENKYAWKKFRGIMEPGVFYVITVGHTNYKTLRFKKVAGEALVASSSVAVSPFPTQTGNNADGAWNGIGNPNLAISNLATSFSAPMQFYDHKTNSFTSRNHSMNLVVGSAFFIQYDAASTVSIPVGTTLHNGYLAPQRERNAIEETIYEVSLTNMTTGEMEDNLFLTAREDATNEYEIGRDLAKMSMGTAKCAQMWVPAYGTKLCAADFPLVNSKATYPLMINTVQAGTYTIEQAAPQENAELYLTKNGHIIWNLTMSPCELELTQGQNEGYGLILRANAPSTATGVDEVQSDNVQCTKVVIDDHVYILRGGKMYGVDGKEVR